MRLERHTNIFDNIVKIEAISESQLADLEFTRKIDLMERDALDYIESLVEKAKKSVAPKGSVGNFIHNGFGKSIQELANQQYNSYLQQLSALRSYQPLFRGGQVN